MSELSRKFCMRKNRNNGNSQASFLVAAQENHVGSLPEKQGNQLSQHIACCIKIAANKEERLKLAPNR